MSLFMRPGGMAAIHDVAKFGSAEIRIDEPDMFTRLRAARDGQPLYAKRYTRLIVDGRVWMTDAEWEVHTNAAHCRRMYGDVLIAGLGIGLVIAPLLKRKDVSSVTVIERSPDVIGLVAPRLAHKKLTVVEADATTWSASRKAYDCIYLDIWPNVPNSDDWPGIKALKARYRPALRKGGWIAAWCEEYARRRDA